MSQPIWTSLDPLTITPDGVLDLGHGNWMQNDGKPLIVTPAPKWLPLIRVDGQVVYGQIPGMPSVAPTVSYPGEVSWWKRLPFDLLPWRDGKAHTLTVDIFAAQYYSYTQQDGTHLSEAWEWGQLNAKGETSQQSTIFTLAPPTPPPPPPPPNGPPAKWTLLANEDAALDILYELIDQWRAAGFTDPQILDTMHYQVIKALSVTDGPTRVKIKLAIKALLP